MNRWPPWRARLARAATKVLRELTDQGMLRLGRGRITVLEPDRLRDEAG